MEAAQRIARLETDHVISEQRIGQLTMIGQRQQQPIGRPGNVEEESDPVGDTEIAKILA